MFGLSSDTWKILYGVTIVCGLALGDFFVAHRLAADSDVFLVLGAVGILGVHVTYQNAISTLTK